MSSSSTGKSPDQRSAGTHWMVLGLGIAMTLAGAWVVARSSFDNPGVAPVVPDTGVRPPAPAGMALTGTILSAKLADIRTIIADARGRQRVYALGGEVPDRGEVIEIHRDYVVLRRDGRLETLEFSWNAVVRILERSARGTVQETPPEDDADNLRAELFTHPELLLDLIGASPVLEGELFIGFRVMQPEDPALLESLGLKPGDILTAVNGVPLDTPDYGAEVLEALSGTGKLTFTVRRGSEILVLN